MPWFIFTLNTRNWGIGVWWIKRGSTIICSSTQIMLPPMFNEESNRRPSRGNTNLYSRSDFLKVTKSRAKCISRRDSMRRRLKPSQPKDLVISEPMNFLWKSRTLTWSTNSRPIVQRVWYSNLYKGL